MPMIEEENSTNARNSIPHYGEYKEFKPKGLEKGFFYPWIGKNSLYSPIVENVPLFSFITDSKLGFVTATIG